MNYPPCLHRIHIGEPQGALGIHQHLGMSISYLALIDRLELLDSHIERLGGAARAQLVTFDDGWADVMCLVPHFEKLLHLQPVLFLTSKQCAGDSSLLPLPRFYEWLGSGENNTNMFADLGHRRRQLKLLSEEDQHLELDSWGVPRVADSPEILTIQQIRYLMGQGWLVGSHGAAHHDLRHADHGVLRFDLRDALEAVLELGGRPWLAWPEGRCCDEICDIAASVGFEKQFSLEVESGSIKRTDVVHREIWK